MEYALKSQKFKDLIITEPDFLGFKRINADKTIQNYKKAFSLYNSTLLNNKYDLEAKTEKIRELQAELRELKTENSNLKSKNTILITNPDFFALEKKKYLDSVTEAIEKAIRFERFKNPHSDRSDDKDLIHEMNRICRDVSQKNQVPLSAFEQIFNLAEVATGLFSILRFGDGNNIGPDQIPIPKKKKRKIYRG